MKLRDRFPRLKDESFVRNMVVKSVYGTMQLEDQGVSMQKINELYSEVKRENYVIPKRVAAF